MIKPDIPKNEQERLIELNSYRILDTLPEEEYDDITRIASQICQTPVSLISLVDEDRQWFKSHYGTDATETPREHAFCAHAINKNDDVLLVQDSRKDDRFYDNPLVTGEPFIVFYAGVPLVTHNGFALGTLCVVDNKPNNLDEQQLKSLKSLANQVVKLFELRKGQIKLSEANRLLEGKYKELEKFALTAAHDIKSPLNNISTIINLVIKENEDILTGKSKRMLNLLESSSEQLRQLVDGILFYSRSDKLLFEDVKEIDLKSYLTALVQLMQTVNNCRISYTVENQKIKINDIAVKQILINLISNAIKYNDKDEIIIEIGFEEKEKNYTFWVIDNGPGINPDFHEQIFNIFEIILPSDRDGKKGSGVGLATVKKLVNGLNGDIWLESVIGKGSCFYFTIGK